MIEPFLLAVALAGCLIAGAIDLKTTWAKGERKIPIDLEASKIAKTTIYDTSDPFKGKFKDYFKFDFRISYKINLKKTSHIIAIDIMNATLRQNHFLESYNAITEKIEETSILEIMPSFLWRMNF